VQVHPQKFWFGENPGKIPQNTDKIVEIWAKYVKTFVKPLIISANSLKIRAKMAPIVLWFEKNGDQITWRLFSCVGRDIFWSFLGKFGKFWAKIFRTPKNLPAPAPILCLRMLFSKTHFFLLNHLQTHQTIHQRCHWLKANELQNHRQMLLL